MNRDRLLHVAGFAFAAGAYIPTVGALVLEAKEPPAHRRDNVHEDEGERDAPEPGPNLTIKGSDNPSSTTGAPSSVDFAGDFGAFVLIPSK